MKIFPGLIVIIFFSLFLLNACKAPAGPNISPIADAGSDISTSDDLTAVILNGSGSTDPDGGSLTFLWSVTATIGVTSATLTDPTSVSPALILSGFDEAGDSVSVQLIVNDGRDDSNPSVLIITHTGSGSGTETGVDIDTGM